VHKVFLFLFLFGGAGVVCDGTGNQTQGLVHARHSAMEPATSLVFPKILIDKLHICGSLPPGFWF
jgi:hypothetical protein